MPIHCLADSGVACCYLLTQGDEAVVVDVGSRGAADAVPVALRRLGFSAGQIRFITATHFHIDHIGGIGYLLQSCPATTRVFFPHQVREYLAGRARLPLMRHWFTAFFGVALKNLRATKTIRHLQFGSLAGIPLPGLRRWRRLPYRPDRIAFFPGDMGKSVPLGWGDWQVMATPGHTADSVSFYHEGDRALLCGDLILHLKPDAPGILNPYHENGRILRATRERLAAAIRPAVIYPGHGTALRDDRSALLGIEPCP